MQQTHFQISLVPTLRSVVTSVEVAMICRWPASASPASDATLTVVSVRNVLLEALRPRLPPDTAPSPKQVPVILCSQPEAAPTNSYLIFFKTACLYLYAKYTPLHQQGGSTCAQLNIAVFVPRRLKETLQLQSTHSAPWDGDALAEYCRRVETFRRRPGNAQVVESHQWGLLLAAGRRLQAGGALDLAADLLKSADRLARHPGIANDRLPLQLRTAQTSLRIAQVA